MDKVQKKKLLDYMERINKSEKRKVMSLGISEEKELVPTGIEYLDNVIGGIPRGSFTMLYGARSAGKTTLAWTIAANFQKLGLTVAYIDAERGLINGDWPKTLGVNTDDVILFKPKTAEEGLVNLEAMSKLGVDLIIFDSIIALALKDQVPDDKKLFDTKNKPIEANKDLDNQEPALLARKLSKWFGRSIGLIDNNKTAVIFINQVRAKLGGWITYETYSGGNALSHTLLLNIRVSKNKDDICSFTVEKTKLNANEHVKIELPFISGMGFDKEASRYLLIYENLKKAGLIIEYVKETIKNGKKTKKTKFGAIPKDGNPKIFATKAALLNVIKTKLGKEIEEKDMFEPITDKLKTMIEEDLK